MNSWERERQLSCCEKGLVRFEVAEVKAVFQAQRRLPTDLAQPSRRKSCLYRVGSLSAPDSPKELSCP